MIRVSISFVIILVFGNRMINSDVQAQTPTIVLVEPVRISAPAPVDSTSQFKPNEIKPNEFKPNEIEPENVAVHQIAVSAELATNKRNLSSEPAIQASAPRSHFVKTGFKPIDRASENLMSATSIPTTISSSLAPSLASAETVAAAEESESNQLAAPEAQSSPNDFSRPVIAVRPMPLRPISTGVDSSYQVRMEPLAEYPSQFRMVVEIPASVREMEIAPKYTEGSRRVRVTIDHESGIAEVCKNEQPCHSGKMTLSPLQSETHSEAGAGNRERDRSETLAETFGHRPFQKNPYFDAAASRANTEIVRSQNRPLKPIANPYASTEYRPIEEAPGVREVSGINQATRFEPLAAPIHTSVNDQAKAPVQIQLSDESVNGNGALYR